MSEPKKPRRRTNEEIAIDRVKSTLGLDLVEDVVDVAGNVLDTVSDIFKAFD